MLLAGKSQSDYSSSNSLYTPADFTILTASQIDGYGVNMVSGGSSSGGSSTPSIGSKTNPYILTIGRQYSTSTSSSYWIKISIGGSINCTLTASPYAQVSIYKGSTASDESLIHHYSHITTLSFQENAIGFQTYYVNVTPDKTINCSFMFDANLDTLVDSKKTNWTVKNNSGCADSLRFYEDRLFFFKSDIYTHLTALKNDLIYNKCISFIKGELSFSAFESAIKLNGLEYSDAAKTLALLSKTLSVLELIDQFAMYTAACLACGCDNELKNAKSGLVYTFYRDNWNGGGAYTVDAWTEPLMQGMMGSRGEFIEPDYTKWLN